MPDAIRVERVFIDTNELFPFTVMDVLLTLSEGRLFDWVWTDELLDEWESVIVRQKRRDAASARSITNTVRTWFGTSRLDPTDYRHLITDELSPDEADRAHVAACLGGRVNVLLTRNTKDFPQPLLATAGVRIMTADDYLVGLLHRHSRVVVDACAGLAATKTRPPVTSCELTERLHRAGASRFAARLAARLDCPPPT